MSRYDYSFFYYVTFFLFPSVRMYNSRGEHKTEALINSQHFPFVLFLFFGFTFRCDAFTQGSEVTFDTLEKMNYLCIRYGLCGTRVKYHMCRTE